MINETKFICPRCGNKDARYFGYRNGHVYCRLCVTFQGKEVGDYAIEDRHTEASLTYPLSPAQKVIADQILHNYEVNKSTLIHAVCGSGKTELVYQVISASLSAGKHVGFAVPRREVVIDLYPRFKGAFPDRSVVAVYGGHTESLTGDIILLTTHQLYRYRQYFDLLILDEIDAFPFKDSTLLINLFHQAVKGSFVMMSATPPDEVVNYFKSRNLPILALHTRYHQHPLPVPLVKIRVGYFKIFYLIKMIKRYTRDHKQVMIFAPTIDECEEVYHLLHLFLRHGAHVHSHCQRRVDIIHRFKNHEFNYLLTTSVLERGVTIKDVQVIIYHADHNMYQKGVLIQIAGRVGRKIDAPTGEVIFLANKKTSAMTEAIKAIQYDNSFL
ncbi:MAG: DEAD/DEAH box helicase [Bacilli bacterium]|nr:DEAD/DEAH box helicase [Bacilli bacterium]